MAEQGIDLGGATLRLYGDRSALDRELAVLRRYTETLERQGIKVKFDADTGKATREVDGLKRNLDGLNKLLGDLGKASHGDFGGLADGLGAAGEAARGATGALGGAGGAMGGLAAGAMKALPILGQLGLAAMGVKAIFQGLAGAINAALAPLEKFSHEADRFNQQVAKGSIFTTRSFTVKDEDGNIIEKTSDQMRALRPLITKEFTEIHREVAKISGATAAEIQEGFNIILQNASNLGTAGEELSNVRNLAVRAAAAMNTLGIPGQQLRSELMSLMTGNIQVYDELGKSLGFTSEKVKELQAQGGTAFYDELIRQLDTLYEGQKVMAESLSNVKSNYQDFFETVGAQGGQRLEAGLAGALQSVLTQLASLEKSFTTVFDTTAQAMEPVIRILGQVTAMLVPLGSILASTFSVVMSIITPLLNLIGALLAPIMETLIGVLNVFAKNAERSADYVNRLLKPLNAFFAVFGDGSTNEVRDFFEGLNKALDNTAEGFGKVEKSIIRFFRALNDRRSQQQADRGLVWDEGKRTFRFRTEEEKQEFVKERRANFDRRVNYDGGVSIFGSQLSAETRAMIDEVQAKNQGFRGLQAGTGGRTVTGISAADIARAKEVAEIRQKTIDNEVKGLEMGLKLMQAQKGVAEAMAQLAEGRRKIDMSRANFAVQLAGSPETRLNAEITQRNLAERQEEARLQERRALLQTERDIQARQAAIQERQAQLQTVQLKIVEMEARLARDAVQASLEDMEEKLKDARGPRATLMAGQISQLRVELQYRQDILVQAERGVELARQGEALAGEIAGVEQQRLDIQEQQLDVLQQQNLLTAEQSRQLDQIKLQEMGLQRQAEQKAQEAAKGKADLEDRLKAMEREQTNLDEQVKLEKARADQAKVRMAQEVESAERVLKIARMQDAATGAGVGVKDILSAQVAALASGQEGMTSVADATRALYDKREKQLLQEQELARQQQRLQQEREQSELRIAALRVRVQQIELAGQLAQQKIALERAKLQVQRDDMSNSVQAEVAAGSGGGTGGAAYFGATGSGWNAKGWQHTHGQHANRNTLLQEGLRLSKALLASGQQAVMTNTNEDITASMSDAQITAAVSRAIDAHKKYASGIYAIDISTRAGGRFPMPLSQVANRGGNGGVTGFGPTGVEWMHLDERSTSSSGGTAPAAPALPPVAGAPATGRGNNRQVAMDYLVQTLGLTPAQAAGVVGNLMQESTASINPRMRYGGSVGLPQGDGPYGAAQWRGSRLQDLVGFAGGAEQAGDLMTQLRFMVHELQGKEARALASLRGAQSPEQAAVVFERDYERAGGSALSTRQAYARTALSEYRPGAAGAPPAGSTAAAFVPATTGQQQVAGAEQQIEILERSLDGLQEVIAQFGQMLANLTERQGIERDTLALQQQGQIGNLRMERTEAVVIERALGSQKAQFYAGVADTFGGWMSGAIKGALQQIRQTGELDLADFAQTLMGGLADRLIEMSVDYVMAPVEAAMKKALFGSLTGIDDEKLKEMVRQEQAAAGQERAAATQSQAADKMNAAADKFATGAPAGALPGEAGPIGLEVQPYNPGASQGTPQGLLEAMEGAPGGFDFSNPAGFDFSKSFINLDGAFKTLEGKTLDLGTVFQDGAQQSANNLSGLQQGIGSALSAVASLGMVFGGIQQVGKGGAGNAVSGIGSILGGIGSFILGNPFGMFGARATGGQANAGQRLLVGENGPEVFEAPANGHVSSNSDLRAAMAGGRGGSSSSAGLRLQMQFQTTRFMDRDWVDREQLEEAMDQAERRGARRGAQEGTARTIDMLKQSPRTRREIGLSSF